MPSRPTTDPTALSEITRLATLGYGGADIHRVLKADPRWSNRDYYVGPSLRTVQDHVKRLQPLDTSGPWSLTHADPSTAGLVLDMLVAVIEVTGGRIAQLSMAHAQWVVTILQARPDLPLVDAWLLAGAAMRRESRGERMNDIETYLAFAPWRGKDEWLRFLSHATEAGLVSDSTADALQAWLAPLMSGEGEWTVETNEAFRHLFVIQAVQYVKEGKA